MKHKNRRTRNELNEALVKAWVGELRFQLLVRDSLLWAIEEVIAFTDDPLAKQVLLLAKEREALDRLIHARTIFWPEPEVVTSNPFWKGVCDTTKEDLNESLKEIHNRFFSKN